MLLLLLEFLLLLGGLRSIEIFSDSLLNLLHLALVLHDLGESGVVIGAHVCPLDLRLCEGRVVQTRVLDF